MQTINMPIVKRVAELRSTRHACHGGIAEIFVLSMYATR